MNELTPEIRKRAKSLLHEMTIEIGLECDNEFDTETNLYDAIDSCELMDDTERMTDKLRIIWDRLLQVRRWIEGEEKPKYGDGWEQMTNLIDGGLLKKNDQGRHSTGNSNEHCSCTDTACRHAHRNDYKETIHDT